MWLLSVNMRGKFGKHMYISLKIKSKHVSERKKMCLFLWSWCPWWCLQGVNLCVLSVHVIRLVIVPCSKQLGCELLLAGLYSSIRRCERMTSDTSGSAVALLQSHNLQHKSCDWVCWATKCHSNLISLSQAVTLIKAAFSVPLLTV